MARNILEGVAVGDLLFERVAWVRDNMLYKYDVMLYYACVS